MWQLAEPAHLGFAILPVALGLFFWLRGRDARRRGLLRFSSPSLKLKRATVRTKWAYRALFLGLSAVLGVFAYVAARPVQIDSWSKRWSEGIDIVLVLDVSESMEADDLAPNRILAAKKVIRDFIAKRTDDRIGLVVFGGEAVTKSPLTRDYEFLKNQVADIKLRELKQGTAIGMGLANGISRLRHSESKNKIIVLLTDGDSNVGSINPITAAHLARQEGIKIYTIGIGKSDRVVVPIYQYDSSGRKTHLIAQVPSYINPALLREVSRLTGGNAYMARDTGMFNRILQEIDKLERTKVKLLPMQRRREMFFYPACIATLLLFLIYLLLESRFRRVKPAYVA